MDPLSVAAAASTLVFSVVRNGRALATVFEKYQNSQRCIFLMQTECTVLAAALSQVQMFFSKVPEAAIGRYPEFVMEALDLSLVGCTLTLSVLSKEIDNLVQNANDNSVTMSKGKKFKYLWNEELMHELLQQLRGQSSALTLLLKALDSASIEQILQIVQSGQPAFQKVRNGAESIRQSHPEEHYAESIMNMTFDDTKTIYSLEVSESVASDDPLASLSNENESTNFTPKTTSSLVGDSLPNGWVIKYSAQHHDWYYHNTVTCKSQWQRPTEPTISPQDINTQKPNQIPSRKPVSAHNEPSNVVISTSQATQPIQKQTLSTAEATINAYKNLDYEPWKLNTSAKFEAALSNLRIEASVPALAVGIVSANAPSQVYVLGDRKRNSQSIVTRADNFSIANSNVFTMTILSILINRGVFRWEETVVDLFPSIANRTHPFHHQTTLGMLGGHHSGMTSQIVSVEDGDLFRYLRRVNGKEGRFAVALSYLVRPPDISPGTAYNWNWANPIIVASAIEERTSTSLESLMKMLIFDPLEMYSAGFGPPDGERNSSVPASPTQPWGHIGSTKEPLNPADFNLSIPPALFASAGIYCSIPDYASFVSMHLRAAMGMPTQVFQTKSPDGLYTRLSDTDWTLGSWMVVSRDWAGGETLSFNGQCNGFSVSTWMAPIKGKAYFAIANVNENQGVDITNNAVVLAIRLASE